MLHLAVKEVLTLTGIFDFVDRRALIEDILLSPCIIWFIWRVFSD
ncbi:MAG: hypothetical protein K0R16_1583 [Nitrososphaeraceae archaeon]|jgi:hypothetical protein|nr:hypothetical protein [Nitrososphaeraceae archaeon]MDF2768402.1 hypothetical protein [Nitrososphaeraceae archaeon]